MGTKLICLKLLSPLTAEEQSRLRAGMEPLVKMGYQVIMVPADVEVSIGNIAFEELKALVRQIETEGKET